MFGLARKLILAAAGNEWLRDQATRSAIVRRSVSAFMPGERLEDAMAAAAAMQPRRIGAIFTRLGENLTHRDEAEEVTEHYLDALDRIQGAGLDACLSVKPTQLGLDLDMDLCFENLWRLVDKAGERGNFVWIDMESSAYVDRTLELFRQLRRRSERVGVALQAYLRRTPADLDALLPIGPAVRLVKGAYLEPASIAFPRKADVDQAYYTLSLRLLDAAGGRSFLQIATHDSRLADRLAAAIDARRIPRTAYEFAMLYGIQRPLQERLARQERPCRVLIAYGDYWFTWYMRRLAERPANLWFVVKNLTG
jgi:proline dehydrogenase